MNTNNLLLDTAGTELLYRSLIFVSSPFVSSPLSQSTTLEGLQHNTSYEISVAVLYMNGLGPSGQPVQNSTPVEGGGCGYCMHLNALALRNIVVDATCVTSVGGIHTHGVCMVCAFAFYMFT